ncbi:MFS transporter [Actinoplanes sp. NPDC089786]|uniref:MFS transporter n=1 Tax=Actinoplanes sp. NPDC089786 TaxID=3155185 RepID=UPI00341FCFBF
MPEPARRRRLLILAICCMSLFIVGLDVTIVNIALPSLRTDLDADVSGLQWVIDAYTLVVASLLILGGSLADRFGRRRVFQTGLALFTAGSLLCGVAPTLGWLIAFRMLQAVGGSMLNPVAMSIITNTFTDRRERARAIGVWGGVVGLSMAAGPVVGGLLVASFGWRSIFWINVPIGVAAIVLVAVFVPSSPSRARRFDPVGQVLVLTVLASLTYGLIERFWPGFVVAALALVLLVRHSVTREDPLLDVRLFRRPPLAGATVIAVCAFAALGGFLFLTTIYLQDVRGYSALHAGLYILPMAAMTFVCAPLSGRLVGARGARPPLVIAGVFIGLSALLLTRLTATSPAALLIVAFVLFGIGFGFVNSPITNTAVSGLPIHQAGVAAAIASTSRNTGNALGVAVLGSLVAGAAVWWIVAALGAAIVVLGVASTRAVQDQHVSSTA